MTALDNIRGIISDKLLYWAIQAAPANERAFLACVIAQYFKRKVEHLTEDLKRKNL